MSSIQKANEELQSGRLIVITDDLSHQQVSYLTGSLGKINSEQVNFMIKYGKGLVYAGINKEQAERLELSLMTGDGYHERSTVSVDYYTSSTGISVHERTVTLQALNTKEARPEDFIRPGHVFPVVFAENGLLERRSVFEAAAEAAGQHGTLANTFLCELLNHMGEVANDREVKSLCQSHNLYCITISSLLREKGNQLLTSFSAKASKIPYVNQAIGFPNINLSPIKSPDSLRTGVYGIRVSSDQQTEIGIMHVNETDGTDNKKILDMYTGDSFLKIAAVKTVTIDVAFYLRPLKFFSSSSIDDLVTMYQKDEEQVKQVFQLLENDDGTKGRFAL